jgi:glycosyltransferase involved in cell wall biosynthesis
MNPLVTVLMPVFNARRFLPEALRSLEAQTFRDFEFIGVDDGSSDGSCELLEQYARREPRARIVCQQNTGIVGALNRGLAIASGKFIARMDADDICMPERFAAQVAFMEVRRDCVAVGSDVMYIDPEGRALVRHCPPDSNDKIMAALLNGNGGAIIHPSVMLRRSAVVAAGSYRSEWQWVEDLDLYLRIAEHGRLANLPNVLLHYRQHSSSVNKRYSNRDSARLRLVNTRRTAIGLGALDETGGSSVPSPKNWRRHWAYDAARGGHWKCAKRNAIRALIAEPWDAENWRCLRYLLARTDTALAE